MGHLSNWLKVKLALATPFSPTYEVFRGGEGMGGGVWYFRQRAANGRVVMTGGEDYYSKGNAKRAAYARAVRDPGSKVRVIDE